MIITTASHHARIMGRRCFGIAAAALTAAVALTGAASAQTDVRFTLDWKIQGPTGFLLHAAQQGLFAAEDLDVQVDVGNGSAGAVTRVASGAYQMGMADINAVIDYNAANPDAMIKTVMMIYDAPPFGVYALKGNGIETPADLVGRTLGAPVFDASYKLFPAFAAANGFDPNDVPRNNMDPSLRETMLVRGEVDFISGHYFSSYLDLQARGVAAEDIVVMRYADYGMDFYGNALIVNPAFEAASPEAVTAFLQVAADSLKLMLEKPELAVEAAYTADPLIDKDLEAARFELAVNTNIVTEYTKANGFGDVDFERLQRAMDQLKLAYGLDSMPTPDQIFDRQYLPPVADRQLP